MKIALFGPNRRVGIVDGDDLIDVEAAYAKLAKEAQGEPVPYNTAAATAPADLEQFILLGDRALDGAREAVAYLRDKAADQLGVNGEQLVFPLATTHLHAPLASRGVKIGMAAANYPDHMLGGVQHRNPSATLQDVVDISRQRGIGGFWKVPSFIKGPYDDVSYPSKTELFDYEAEVAIVLGKQVRDGKAEDLNDAIWGYTLINDWSARDQSDVFNLTMSLMKNFDGAGTVGPFIVVDEIDDPQDVPFTTHVNGELRQSGNTRDMIFKFHEFFEFMTRDMTFYPGDMIGAGTCAGCALDSSPRDADYKLTDTSLFLKVGDVVEVASPLIGTLRNTVVAKS